MEMRKVCWALNLFMVSLIIHQTANVQGLIYGTPVENCRSMLPQHDRFLPQIDPAPYNFTATMISGNRSDSPVKFNGKYFYYFLKGDLKVTLFQISSVVVRSTFRNFQRLFHSSADEWPFRRNYWLIRFSKKWPIPFYRLSWWSKRKYIQFNSFEMT